MIIFNLANLQGSNMKRNLFQADSSNNVQCVQDGRGELLFLITDRRNIFWDFRGQCSSWYERTFWFLKKFFDFATMTFSPKIVRGDPYDRNLTDKFFKNSFKNINVRSYHEERWPRKSQNVFCLSVIKKRSSPLPSWTHCSTEEKNRNLNG